MAIVFVSMSDTSVWNRIQSIIREFCVRKPAIVVVIVSIQHAYYTYGYN